MWLLSQEQASRNVCGVISQEDAEIVFLLRDLPLQICDCGLGGIHQLFCLANVEQSAESVLLLGLRQLKRILPRG
jgi:hypothetical protein